MLVILQLFVGDLWAISVLVCAVRRQHYQSIAVVTVVSALCLLDLTATFNTVDHDGVWSDSSVYVVSHCSGSGLT